MAAVYLPGDYTCPPILGLSQPRVVHSPTDLAEMVDCPQGPTLDRRWEHSFPVTGGPRPGGTHHPLQQAEGQTGEGAVRGCRGRAGTLVQLEGVHGGVDAALAEPRLWAENSSLARGLT